MMNTKKTKKLKKKSQLFEIWKQLRKKKLAVVSMIVLCVLILVAVFAPLLAPYSYETQDVRNGNAPSSAEHWLGTDKLGRDILSRIMYGARVALMVGIISTTIAV